MPKGAPPREESIKFGDLETPTNIQKEPLYSIELAERQECRNDDKSNLDPRPRKRASMNIPQGIYPIWGASYAKGNWSGREEDVGVFDSKLVTSLFPKRLEKCNPIPSHCGLGR
jgi:hypothetical protein